MWISEHDLTFDRITHKRRWRWRRRRRNGICWECFFTYLKETERSWKLDRAQTTQGCFKASDGHSIISFSFTYLALLGITSIFYSVVLTSFRCSISLCNFISCVRLMKTHAYERNTCDKFNLETTNAYHTIWIHRLPLQLLKHFRFNHLTRPTHTFFYRLICLLFPNNLFYCIYIQWNCTNYAGECECME